MINAYFTHALLDFAYVVIRDYKMDIPVIPEWIIPDYSEEAYSEIQDISKTLLYYMVGSLYESKECFEYILEYCPETDRKELIDLVLDCRIDAVTKIFIDKEGIINNRLSYLLGETAYNFVRYLRLEKENNERVRRAFGVLDNNRNDNKRAYVYNCAEGDWCKDVKEGFIEPEVDEGTSSFYTEKYGVNVTYLCSEASKMIWCIDRPGFSRMLEKMKSDRPRFLIVPRLDHVIASNIQGVLLCESLLNSIGVELIVAHNQYLYLKNIEFSFYNQMDLVNEDIAI